MSCSCFQLNTHKPYKLVAYHVTNKCKDYCLRTNPSCDLPFWIKKIELFELCGNQEKGGHLTKILSSMNWENM